MTRRLSLKLALAATVVAIALIQRPPGDAHLFPTGTLVLLAVIGTFVELPGTGGVRAAMVALAVVGLLFPALKLTIALIVLLCVPVLFVAAALQTLPAVLGDPEGVDEPSALSPKLTVSALITAVAIGSLAYRMLTTHHLEQTAALFVGLPAVMAIVVVYFVSPNSAAGVACKAVTLGLLVSLIMLWEGFLCVLMAAPLFFAVAVVVAQGMEMARRDRERGHGRLFSCLVVLAIVPFALEGVTPWTTIARDETVSASRVIAAAEHAVARAMFEPPRFERVPARYLRIGFPSPTAARIDRGPNQTRWIVQVRGGEMRMNGMEPRTGELVLELAEQSAGFLRWRAVSDSSHMTHFLRWRDASVRWQRVDDDHTQVTWTVHYRRGLDPAWYFGPFERYAVTLAADYLIETVARP